MRVWNSSTKKFTITAPFPNAVDDKQIGYVVKRLKMFDWQHILTTDRHGQTYIAIITRVTHVLNYT